MKTIIKLNIIVIFVLCCYTAVGQQLPQFTQYMYNTISINPAYAGSRETLSLVGLHRSQWVGIDGGPTTQTFSIHSPMRNEKVGLGLSFINDELGYQNFSFLYADFSYTIQTGNNTKLAFGLKSGFTSYSFDNELFLETDGTMTGDPSLLGLEDRWGFNVGAGVFWHSDKWYVGYSMPRILNTDYHKQDGFEALERVSHYLTAGYVFDLGGNTKFKPAAMLKATDGAPLSFDLTGNFLFNEKFWLGAGYRFNESAGALGGLVDFQVSKSLRIGYTYEHPISDIRPYSDGTHEILLMFEIFNEKRIKSPRYF